MIYNLAKPSDILRMDRDIKHFLQRGNVTISVNECRKKRSIAQNKLYWLWLTCIADETGNNKDALHEFFKEKYLSVKRYDVAFNGVGGNVFARESTTDLDTKGMTLYLDCIQKFALAECDIALPHPDEQGWEEFYEKYNNFISD
jgi:hypothetical protein